MTANAKFAAVVGYLNPALLMSSNRCCRCNVMLISLVSSSKHNGKHGVLTSPLDPATGRCKVTLKEEGLEISVRPQNIIAVEDESKEREQVSIPSDGPASEMAQQKVLASPDPHHSTSH